MKTDGHIGFEGQTECKLNKLGDLGVTMLKTERPQHDGQPSFLVADDSDPTA